MFDLELLDGPRTAPHIGAMKCPMKPIPNTFTETDLTTARQVFRQRESRDLFYRAARELVRLAIAKQTDLTVAEALGTLLQTWNKSFYRFHAAFDETHIRALEALIEQRMDYLLRLRARSIDTMGVEESEPVGQLYAAFETILGPVGAAKALHLLAPRFFPLWDRAIANHYGIRLSRIGENTDNYLRFVHLTQRQVSELPTLSNDEEILKMIDEYNYCVITKAWL